MAAKAGAPFLTLPPRRWRRLCLFVAPCMQHLDGSNTAKDRESLHEDMSVVCETGVPNQLPVGLLEECEKQASGYVLGRSKRSGRPPAKCTQLRPVAHATCHRCRVAPSQATAWPARSPAAPASSLASSVGSARHHATPMTPRHKSAAPSAPFATSPRRATRGPSPERPPRPRSLWVPTRRRGATPKAVLNAAP